MTPHDYARSFIHFRTSRVNHTPRLQIDASCRITTSDGRTREFFLSAPCVGESMYVTEKLIQEPTYEFVMIAEPDSEYAIFKKGASAERDVHEAHRFGEAMSTFSGKPAAVLLLNAFMARFPSVRPLTTYEAIQEAHQANRPVIGQTGYLAEDGKSQVALEYPVKILNLPHDQPRWQVDTGPVLVPDFSAEPAKGADLMVGKLFPAYLVYNSWERAEIAVRRKTGLSAAKDGPQTSHYSGVKALSVQNQLFAAVL